MMTFLLRERMRRDFLGVERHDPFDGSWLATMPSSPASFSTASRMTPSVEPQPTSVTAAFSGPTSLGGAMCRHDGLHLARALLHHHAALVRVGEFVADERAVLVVLVGGGDVDVAGHARHGAGRDAALGVLVAQIGVVVVAAEGIGALAVAVGQDQFAAVDLHVEVQFRRVNAGGALGDQQVGQHQAGALVFVAEIEQLGDGLEQRRAGWRGRR